MKGGIFGSLKSYHLAAALAYFGVWPARRPSSALLELENEIVAALYRRQAFCAQALINHERRAEAGNSAYARLAAQASWRRGVWRICAWQPKAVWWRRAVAKSINVRSLGYHRGNNHAALGVALCLRRRSAPAHVNHSAMSHSDYGGGVMPC